MFKCVPGPGGDRELCYIASMYADSDIIPGCIVRPGSFGGLMALYESNFIKLDRLVGEFISLDGSYRSTPDLDCDAHLTVEAESRYTSRLFLTYRIEEKDRSRITPGLALKVYSDARLAEVRQWFDIERNDVLRRLRDKPNSEIDRRWACNMLLSKWLDYLIDMDHEFVRDTVGPVPVEMSVRDHVFA